MESKTERVMRSDIGAVYHEIPSISGISEIFIAPLIISGGQDGVDAGGLKGAAACGIPTGGVAPKGWRTESGTHPELGTVYGLVESNSTAYNQRTAQNVELADAVILVARNFYSPGTKLTKQLAIHLPVFDVPYPTLPRLEDVNLIDDLQFWLAYHKPCVLMIAGNRESVAPGIEKWTENLMTRLFLRP